MPFVLAYDFSTYLEEIDPYEDGKDDFVCLPTDEFVLVTAVSRRVPGAG